MSPLCLSKVLLASTGDQVWLKLSPFPINPNSDPLPSSFWYKHPLWLSHCQPVFAKTRQMILLPDVRCISVHRLFDPPTPLHASTWILLQSCATLRPSPPLWRKCALASFSTHPAGHSANLYWLPGWTSWWTRKTHPLSQQHLLCYTGGAQMTKSASWQVFFLLFLVFSLLEPGL